MNRFVVGAAVAAKWFVPEPGWEPAVRLFEASNELYVTDSFFTEFARIMGMKARAGEISREEALKVFSALEKVNLAVFPSNRLIEAALEIAIDRDLSITTCLDLSLAVWQDCRLVTASRELYEGLSATPFSRNLKWFEHSR